MDKTTSDGEQKLAAHSVSLPKRGGAICDMVEKFAAYPVVTIESMTAHNLWCIP